MENFEILQRKLEAFIKRYYINELLKGTIFFIAIGLIYVLCILVVEYFFWLPQFWRSVLFWGTILVEVALLLRFIIYPLLKLFKISKGLNHKNASRIIGNHFPEVRDKLLNVLQLRENSDHSDLLLAGIDQKARELKPIPFSLAIDFKQNLPFLKYAAIPLVVFLLIYVTGNSHVFKDSYERVVHYKVAYAPPAPFIFSVMNPSLRVKEGETLRLQVKTQGRVIPETAAIHYEGQKYFLSQMEPGRFEYRFESLREGTNFYISANGIKSQMYDIEVVKVPRMTDFKMSLFYPAYTGLKNETKDATGNAVIPEGTRVTWELETRSTEKVAMQLADTVIRFHGEKDQFNLKQTLFDDLDYTITTSNKEIEAHEKIAYSINVVKDAYPALEIEEAVDSLNPGFRYFYGKVSDDYGISRLQLVFYPTEEPDIRNSRQIPIGKATYGEFVYAFPDTLQLESGRAYSYYFEVFDNDGLRNTKSTKSGVFHFRKPTPHEMEENALREQRDALKGLDRSLEDLQLTEKEIKELEQLRLEKQELSYSDRKKLQGYLRRQKQQNEMMKSFSEKLKKSFEEKNESRSQMEKKEQLKDRLDRQEERLEENEKLLEELEEYSRKLNEEGLQEKLEKLSRNRQNQERSLEQLLELTKRYYVEEKSARIARDLKQLGDDQEGLAGQEDGNTEEAQDSIIKDFEDISRELEELREENQGLKDPVELGMDPELEEEINSEQEKSLKNLREGERNKAGEHQKNAGKKMKKMGEMMEEMRQEASAQQMQEDVEMLRQILDNLLVFSFEQEDLMERFKKGGVKDPGYASKLRRQNDLKENFSHVDDSIFALALRNPIITENITEKITNVEYDLNRSLERLSENELEQGMGSQQYIVTGANDLAYFLSRILDNMQDMMSRGQGEGGGNQKQLPDIIQEQKELGEQMKEGLERKEQFPGGKKEGRGNEQEEEKQSGELFEIFRQQQMLRKALEERLEKEGLNEQGNRLQKEMEQLEEDILLKGYDRNTLRKMMELEHKLLELEKAVLEQGERSERESRSNERTFENPVNNQIIKAKEYFNTTEILNRQILPLRQIYKQKVKEYFEREDH